MQPSSCSVLQLPLFPVKIILQIVILSCAIGTSSVTAGAHILNTVYQSRCKPPLNSPTRGGGTGVTGSYHGAKEPNMVVRWVLYVGVNEG